MDEEELAGRRMVSVGLAGPAWYDVRDVVRRLGAVQAQEFGPALWSLRQRVDRTDEVAAPAGQDAAPGEGDLLAEFDAGNILRTHVLRPTWHFVLPADIRWLLTLTAPRVHVFNRYYYGRHELTDEVLGRCRDLVAKAIERNGPQTRTELAAALGSGGVPADSLRLGLILMHTELEQVLCSGPRRGNQHTYALLDQRVPPASPLGEDEALAELATRYFGGHGPATVKDFAWWSSLTMAQCRRAIDIAGDRLDSVAVGDTTYWAGSPMPEPKPPQRPVQLLQPYDEYLVAYRDSQWVSDGADLNSRRPERGAYIGLLIRGSQLAGYWKRTLSASVATIHVQLFEPFDADSLGELRTAADEHAAFVGRAGALAEPELLVSA